MLQSVQFNTRFFYKQPLFSLQTRVAKVVCLSQAKSRLVGCLRILVTKAFIKARYNVMLSSQMLSRIGLWLYIFTIYGSFLNFKVIFMKFCKKSNYFCCFIVAQALRIIQPLRNAPVGEGDSGFYYEAWGRGSQVISLRNALFSCHWLFLFTSGKVTWAMSAVVIYVSKYVCYGKEKTCGPTILLESYIQYKYLL